MYLQLVILITFPLLDFAAEVDVNNAFLSNNGRNEERIVYNVWQKMREGFRIDLDRVTSGIASSFERTAREANISNDCVNRMKYVFNKATDGETQAIKMIDSWGKFPPSGVLTGTFTSYGSHDECLQIESISTHYCTVLFRYILPQRPRYHNILHNVKVFENSTLNENKLIDAIAMKSQFYYYTPFRIGVCLPIECTVKDVDKFAFNVAKKILMRGQAMKCESEDSLEERFNIHQIIALVFFLLIAVMSIVGTLTDLFTIYGKTPSFATDCLIAFSIRKNFSTLLNVKTSSYELKCLNGIRVLTMAWIILGHTAIWIHFQTFSQSYNIIDIITPFNRQALLNATLSVETFFVLSGLLTSYVTWSTIQGDYNNFSAIWYLISRYVRLTPGLVAAIAGTFFLPFLGSGPLWHEIIDPVVNNCKANWWINLLYLQNYINSEQICLLPSWWLAVDMHFHIVSSLIVIALIKRPMVGLVVTAATVIGFSIAATVIHFINGYPATIVATHPQIEEYWTEYVLQFFYRPYVHAGPFFVGLLLGFLLAKKRFLKLSTGEAVGGWTIAILLMVTLLYTPNFWNMGNTSSKLVAAVYDSCNRTFWAIAVSWVIYACASGYGGLIDSFLSWPCFVPFARLTFTVYLTHMWLVWCFMATRRELLHTSTYTAVYMFVAHWFLAYTLGFLFSLLFESPFLVIQKLVVKRNQRRIDNNNTVDCRLTLSKLKSDNYELQQPKSDGMEAI